MSKYIVDVEDNDIKSCKIYEPLKFEEDKIRIEERKRIVGEFEDWIFDQDEIFFPLEAIVIIREKLKQLKGEHNEN